MGTDLKLLPLEAEPDTEDFDVPRGGWEALCVLPTDRSGQLFDAIHALPLARFPFLLRSPMGALNTDAWGAPLRTVLSGDLASLSAHPHVVGSVRNRAAWAYVAALPLGTRVVLFWL